jgi:hypothetical protein
MTAIVQLLTRHGYAIVFAAVFARQLGFPVPAPGFLIEIARIFRRIGLPALGLFHRAAAYLGKAGTFLAGALSTALLFSAARKVHWHRWRDEP